MNISNFIWCIKMHVLFALTKNIYKLIIAARQGSFIVPYVWEIVVRKDLTNLEGCQFARFYNLIWWSFPKIEIKNFNWDPFFFNLVKLGTISPAEQLCSHWKKPDDSSNHFWFFFWKTLRKIKRSFLRFLNYKHKKKL